jgi:hypothetical protein
MRRLWLLLPFAFLLTGAVTPDEIDVWGNIANRDLDPVIESYNCATVLLERWPDKIKDKDAFLREIANCRKTIVDAAQNLSDLSADYEKYPNIISALDPQKFPPLLAAIDRFANAIDEMLGANSQALAVPAPLALHQALRATAAWIRDTQAQARQYEKQRGQP